MRVKYMAVGEVNTKVAGGVATIKAGVNWTRKYSVVGVCGSLFQYK
jgi:hypothetical protein